ncbi:unnamed protein product [Symbiodinium natans]|uniref:Uncharacterized protein n=1 Tax=Symbiodinium natans TaxID=878477 RepID=A0A812TYJ2_9DINO|nr:unnamed protein product [Symbiodinium natans]
MQEGPWTNAAAEDVEQHASCAKVLVNGEFLLWWALFYGCPAEIALCLLKHNPDAATRPRPSSAEPVFLALASGHSLAVFDALLALAQPQQALRSNLRPSLQLLQKLGHTGVAQACKTRPFADADGLLHVCLRLGAPEALLERLVEIRPDLVTSATLLEALQRPTCSVKSAKLWRRLAELEPSGKLVALRAIRRTVGSPMLERTAQAPCYAHGDATYDPWANQDPWAVHQMYPVPAPPLPPIAVLNSGHTGETPSPISHDVRSAFLAEFGLTTSHEEESQMEMREMLEEELDRGPSARPAEVRRLLQKLAGAAQHPIAAQQNPGKGGKGGLGKGGKGQTHGPVYPAQMAAVNSCPAAVTRMLFAQWPEVARCPIPMELGHVMRLRRHTFSTSNPTYLNHLLTHDVQHSLSESRHGLDAVLNKELVLAAQEVVMFAPELVQSSACAQLLERCPSDEKWLAVKEFWLGLWQSVEATEAVSESCFQALVNRTSNNRLQLCRDTLPVICRKNPRWLVEGPRPHAWLCHFLAEAGRSKQEVMLPERDWARERLLHMAHAVLENLRNRNGQGLGNL